MSICVDVSIFDLCMDDLSVSVIIHVHVHVHTVQRDIHVHVHVRIYTCIFTCTFISDGWKGTQPSPLLKAHGMNNLSEAFANGSQVRTS